MSRFSGALQLADLDDFITPSQECIKPIKTVKPKTRTGAKVKIGDGDYMDVDAGVRGGEKLKKVEITLADCLACSGCITSAESVLVTKQSQEEILRVFKEKKYTDHGGNARDARLIVVSLSPPPVLSLAARYKMSPTETARRLAGYFKSLGANLVLDMTCAEDFALLEAQREFLQRYQNHQQNPNGKSLPMLASSCPGWVCYAEKTHGNFILPYISTTKSPQQIMGSLVKHHMSKALGVSPGELYHVTVMPCYDKKLEASREDFYSDLLGCHDVDCVITAVELEQMLDSANTSLECAPEADLDQAWSCGDGKPPTVKRHEGSGSGGYTHHIFQYAARHLFSETSAPLVYKSVRNPDFREVILERDGKEVLRFAIANGFRNIQNLVQKLKRGKSPYHYVEVMACPSGCLNGGAQVRPPLGENSKELVSQLEATYETLDLAIPEHNDLVKKLYTEWLDGRESDKAHSLLHTSYHAVEKSDIALNIKCSGVGRCPKYPPLPEFNILKMSGTWYEVERSFYLMEMAASCTKLNITINDRSQYLVNVTTVSRWTNMSSSSCGVGIPSANGSSTFRYKPNNRLPYAISRLLPGAGMYNIIFTDYDSFAILWSCSSLTVAFSDQIWLLGRERDFSAALRSQIYCILRDVNLDPDRLILSKNTDCST